MTRPVMATAEVTPETETDDSVSSSTALVAFVAGTECSHFFSIFSYQFSLR